MCAKAYENDMSYPPVCCNKGRTLPLSEQRQLVTEYAGPVRACQPPDRAEPDDDDRE